MQFKHIFGPVLSRRLGVSLGVDLVTHKICSMDCVYCECGKTTQLTLDRKEYVKYEDVTKELDQFFQQNQDPDYITFSGSGEPTLNSRLGEVIQYIKTRKPDIKVAVLTNSSLFSDPKVREELMASDLIVPSLDAVRIDAFSNINRPDSRIDVENIINGLETFSSQFSGKIWLEVFILPGMNDNQVDLEKLKKVIQRINPDRVQLNTLDRPGTKANIYPASKKDLDRVIKELDFPNIEIIAKVDLSLKVNMQREDIKTAILETIHRRPCTKEDLVKILGVDPLIMDETIEHLEKENKIFSQTQARGTFYQTIKLGQKTNP